MTVSRQRNCKIIGPRDRSMKMLTRSLEILCQDHPAELVVVVVVMADPAVSLIKNGLHNRRKARKSHPLHHIRLKKMKLLNLQPQQHCLLWHLQQQPQPRVPDQQCVLNCLSSILSTGLRKRLCCSFTVRFSLFTILVAVLEGREQR